MKIYACLLILAIIASSCSTNSNVNKDYPRVRKFSEWKSSRYHKDIQLKIGWYPYKEQQVNKTDNNSIIINSDSTIFAGAAPIIILTYPDSTSTIWLNMDIEDALLGKLIKHSLMTQIPIKKPFGEYLVEADCSSCHPASKKHLIEN